MAILLVMVCNQIKQTRLTSAPLGKKEVLFYPVSKHRMTCTSLLDTGLTRWRSVVEIYEHSIILRISMCTQNIDFRSLYLKNIAVKQFYRDVYSSAFLCMARYATGTSTKLGPTSACPSYFQIWSTMPPPMTAGWTMYFSFCIATVCL